MAEHHEDAAVTSRRRPSAVWIVPLVAMALGVWLVVNAWLQRGPVVEIEFTTAEGLEEETTPVKVRNVQVGVVSDIALNENLSGVTVTVELAADARRLLREDTQFWVVRPRVSTSGISGLGTIVSGAYIEVAPGVGDSAADYRYTGLEHAPLTPAGTPGLRVTLVSETSGSLGVGDPVLYRGYAVGRVEDARLDVQAQEVRYSAFIEAPHDALVTTATRFWNASGISAEVTADGVVLNLASLETLIAGGVAFDLPESASPGGPVPADETFQLYSDEASITDNPHRYAQEYVVSFHQSVRGLSAGAPVTFRGITVGTVERIMMGEGTSGVLNEGDDRPIPVLIRVEPGRFAIEDSRAGVRRLREAMAQAVENGLRGSLETGNLLTGSLYVNLDFFEDVDTTALGEFQGHPAIPTVSTGLGQLQQQVSQLLSKLNRLPLEQSLESADGALAAIRDATRELEVLIDSEAMQNLPGRMADSLDQLDRTLSAYSEEAGLPDQIQRTLNELDRTLKSVRSVSENLERDPSSVIFPTDPPADPRPEAGAP